MTTPTHSPGDEWLSSYFDGELSDAERTEVEGRLEASSTARRELDELGEVSELVRRLPRARLGGEFPARVMARIEREMLLGAPQKSAADVPVRHRGRWIAGLSALTTIAAATLLIVLLGPTGPSDHPIAQNEPVGRIAEAGRSQTEAASAERALRLNESASSLAVAPADAEDRNATLARRGGVEQKRAAPVAEAEVAGREEPEELRLRAQHGPEGAGAAVPMPAEAGAARFAAGLEGIDLQNPQVGDVVEYAVRSEQGVAVVALTVVDVNDAVGALKVLLIPNGQPQLRELQERADRTPLRTKADAARFKNESVQPPSAAQNLPQELMAVYVESTGDRLAAALEEMHRLGILDHQQLQAPVDPANVEVALLAPVGELADAAENEREASPRLTLDAAVRLSKAQATASGGASEARAFESRGKPADRPANDADKSVQDQADAPVRQPQPRSRRADPGSAARADETIVRQQPGRPAPAAESNRDAKSEPAVLTGVSFQLLFNARAESLQTAIAAKDAAGASSDGAAVLHRRLQAHLESRRAAASRPALEADAETASATARPLRVILVLREHGSLKAGGTN